MNMTAFVSTLLGLTNAIAKLDSKVDAARSTSMSVNPVHARMKEPVLMNEVASDVSVCQVSLVLSYLIKQKIIKRHTF